MSDPHGITTTPSHGGHASGHHGGSVALPFNDTEVEQFHEDDRHAGGAIIVLMTAIFSIGLILYTVIAVIVAR